MKEENVYLSPFVNVSISHLAQGESKVYIYAFTQNTGGENLMKLLLIKTTTLIGKTAREHFFS